ncbi:hypothetical protein CBD41_06340 [bacterium TMED181]|nr:hypothetical protein [Planctomycetota bacterium]OUW44078.1 MAG: hypothetical protein CBD41_06340 [bacterium TMED181]
MIDQPKRADRIYESAVMSTRTVLIHDVSLRLGESEQDLLRAVTRKLKIGRQRVQNLEIRKRSLDCRRGRPPRWIHSVVIETDSAIAELLLEKGRARPWSPERVEIPEYAGSDSPVVIGTGPAGLFCAMRLIQAGARPRVIERGPEVVERSRRWNRFIRGEEFEPECNLLYGEGGAGAYSDGKLYTRVQDPRVIEVLEALVEYGAPKEILTDGRPHVGSNLLPSVVKRMRNDLIQKGAQFFFDHRFVDFVSTAHKDSTQLTGLKIEHQGEVTEWEAETVFLASGHSARDVYRCLARHEVPMTRKPFQLGVRIEHPQEVINAIQYGDSAGHSQLPPADYSLVAKSEDGEIYSFCMCPGGEILPSSERDGYLCVNGASRYQRRSPWANSGFVVTLEPEHFGAGEDPLAGILLQEQIEKAAYDSAGGDFAVPALRLSDFLSGEISEDLPECSYPRPLIATDFAKFLPEFILEPLRSGLRELVRRIPEFDHEHAVVTAPESRSSSPVRIDRDGVTFESSGLSGLYPLGEGAGYAGGILSAALDGMKAAESWTTMNQSC